MRAFPAAAAVSLLTLSACAAHNLTPLAPRIPSAVNVTKAEAFSAATCATFSVFPLSLVSASALIKEGSYERAMLFSLRNAMEAQGYRFVRLDESPDLLVTLDLAWSRLAQLDPKRPIEAARPTRITPPNLASYGILTEPWRSRQAPAGWGTMPEGRAGAKLVPGYPSGRKFVPGLYEIRVTVAVLDGKTLEEGWTGAGVCVSGNANPAVGSQPVLWKIANAFPAALLTELNAEAAGVPGLIMRVATNDGEDYFPAVLGVRKGSPAWKGGAKTCDMILAVGGESARNKPLSEIESELNGPVDIGVTMTVWRKSALEWHRNPVQTAMCILAGSCETADQTNLMLAREKVVQLAGAPAAIEPVQPAVFDIPPRRPEVFKMCLVPTTCLTVMGLLLYAGLSAD